jgi:hypothetical protein
MTKYTVSTRTAKKESLVDPELVSLLHLLQKVKEKMTLDQIAARLGCNRSLIGHWKVGRSKISEKHLKMLENLEKEEVFPAKKKENKQSEPIKKKSSTSESSHIATNENGNLSQTKSILQMPILFGMDALVKAERLKKIKDTAERYQGATTKSYDHPKRILCLEKTESEQISKTPKRRKGKKTSGDSKNLPLFRYFERWLLGRDVTHETELSMEQVYVLKTDITVLLRNDIQAYTPRGSYIFITQASIQVIFPGNAESSAWLTFEVNSIIDFIPGEAAGESLEEKYSLDVMNQFRQNRLFEEN